jgi:hypothetical protein
MVCGWLGVWYVLSRLRIWCVGEGERLFEGVPLFQEDGDAGVVKLFHCYTVFAFPK